MSADRDVTRIVRSWLQTEEHGSANRVLANVLDRLDATPQRRPWWRAWRINLMSSTRKFAMAGAVALVVVAAGLTVYLSRPAIGPSGTATPGQSGVTPTGSPVVTTQPTHVGSTAPWVVFLRGDGRLGTGHDDLWAVRTDGSDAHEILAGLFYANVAWSQDGSRLLVADGDEFGRSHLYLAEVSDSIGPFVEAGFGTGMETACNEKSRQPAPCQDWGFSFAPDGQRVVLRQTCTYSVPGCAFLTILDLTTGERTELSETLIQGRNAGFLGDPSWSPDGSQLAFVIEDGSLDQNVAPAMNLYLINAAGTDLRQVDLPIPRVAAPQWSPDGTALVFMSDVYSEGGTVLTRDIYRAHPDGTDLRQLTTDLVVSEPSWTLTGQIRFRNGTDSEPAMTYSLMDADGANVIPYADMERIIRAMPTSGSEGEYAVPGYLGQSFYWQPHR